MVLMLKAIRGTVQTCKGHIQYLRRQVGKFKTRTVGMEVTYKA